MNGDIRVVCEETCAGEQGMDEFELKYALLGRAVMMMMMIRQCALDSLHRVPKGIMVSIVYPYLRSLSSSNFDA